MGSDNATAKGEMTYFLKVEREHNGVRSRMGLCREE
jgi:hypothetical protein